MFSSIIEKSYIIFSFHFNTSVDRVYFQK